MEPIGLIVGFLAGVITTVVVASMGMMAPLRASGLRSTTNLNDNE